MVKGAVWGRGRERVRGNSLSACFDEDARFSDGRVRVDEDRGGGEEVVGVVEDAGVEWGGDEIGGFAAEGGVDLVSGDRRARRRIDVLNHFGR